MRILVVAAHPDDETCGMGGTIARYSGEGAEVYVCILSDGVTVRHQEVKRQRECARRACHVLGVKEVFFHDLPDQRLDQVGLLEVVRPIEKHVSELKPQIVFCPPWEDVNQDHRAAFEATMVAARPVPGSPVQCVLSYEIPSSTEWSPATIAVFKPNVFLDISDHMEQKLSAMREYASAYASELKAFPHPRSLEGLRVYAQQRGISVGLPCAEAFHLFRAIGWPVGIRAEATPR